MRPLRAVVSGSDFLGPGEFRDNELMEVVGDLVFTEANTFADADATPDVSGAVRHSTANTGATTITDFDGGTEGQLIMLEFDANTTLQHGANIALRGGADVTGPGVRFLLNHNGVWEEVGAAGGGGSSWGLVTSHDFGATPQSSLEFDLTGLEEVFIFGRNITCTALILLQVSPDAGATWRTALTDYWRDGMDLHGSTEAIDTSRDLQNIAGFYGGYGGASTPASIESRLFFFGLNSVPTRHQYHHMNNAAGQPSQTQGRGQYKDNEVHNRARLLGTGSVNITTGVVYVLGR